MKHAVASLTLALMASVSHAQSWFQFEAGIGATRYSVEDGRWFQQGMPGGSEVTRTAPAVSLGITGPLVTRGRWGVDYHADYVNLGRAASECMCTPMDENYDAHAHKYTQRYDVAPAYFSGSGRSQGVALTVEPYYWIGGYRAGLELGAYVHHDTWSEYVAGWQVPRSIPAQTFTVSASYWAVAPVAGVSFGNGRLAVSYRHYFTRLNSQRAAVPPLWNDADVLSVTYKW